MSDRARVMRLRQAGGVAHRPHVWVALAVVTVMGMAAWSCAQEDPDPVASGFDVTEKSIPELAQAMESGEVTSRGLVEGYLERIGAYDERGPALRAMITVNANALAEADVLDAERATSGPRGPLHGVPVIVKDNFDTVDMPTTGGIIALATSVPPDDAFQVRKLREAGAIILGKANLHELARGITTISSFGGQTRNPYDPERNPGGSSGGTGAAVAASFAAAGMGTDTCGSIRIPSSHNALVGLRGTRGLSSRDGIIPLSHTQDIGGPLTRTVTDLVAVLDATVGFDPADESTQLSEGSIPESYAEFLVADALQGARLGILTELVGDARADRPVGDVIEAAVKQMKSLGAETIDLTETGLPELLEGSGLREFKFDFADYLSRTPDAPVRSLDEIVERGLYHAALERGNRTSMEVESLDTDEYREAFARRDEARQAAVALMDANELDALIYPTIRQTAMRIGTRQTGSNCRLSAQSGLPAITVPAGFAEDGMPVGVELLGRAFAEPRLIALAYAYEQATNHRRPPVTTPSLVSPPGNLTASAEAHALDADHGVTARASFRVDRSSLELIYSTSVAGARDSDVLGFHLHRGQPDVSGPIVFLLGGRGVGRASGAVKLSPGDLTDLREGGLYFDVHTTAQLNGVRGQLVALEE